MRVLLDTNLLTRLANPANQAIHAAAEAAVVTLPRTGHAPCLLPQIVYEFWAVATRPVAGNGLGMSPEEAREEIDTVLTKFPVLQDERGIFFRWLDLVTAHEVRGKNTHDTRIVAAMLRHGLTHLVTFNTKDFARFPEVIALTPQEVVDGKLPAAT